jgi:NADPH-dependent F420 reductase
VVQSIGIVGGTGPEGKGLAARFARAGVEVIIGSRSAERGEAAAAEVAGLTGGKVRGGTNLDAAAGEVVIITLPYDGLKDTLGPLAATIGGKIVVSAVVPMRFEGGRPQMVDVADGSAAEEIRALLPQARVVGAFQNLSAHKLMDVDHGLEGDVIVCADDREALQATIDLAGLIEGIRGVNGGPLSSSRYVEAITALLVNINRVHRTETHVQIVGI